MTQSVTKPFKAQKNTTANACQSSAHPAGTVAATRKLNAKVTDLASERSKPIARHPDVEDVDDLWDNVPV